MTFPLKTLLLVTTLALSACGEEQKHEQQSKAPVSNTQTQTQAQQQQAAKNEKNSQPDIAQQRLDKGSKLWAENKLDLAEAEFRKAIQEHPKSAKAHARLAGLLLTQNKTTEAVPVYQDAIILDPKNPKLFAALSIAYLHQSRFSMAKAMADRAIELDPNLKEAAKLNEYIEAKQKAIAQASKVAPGSVKPNDATHGGSSTAPHTNQDVAPTAH